MIMINILKEELFDAIIVTGGRYPSIQKWQDLIKKESLIIAADSGLQQLISTDRSPTHIIGDFDSLPNSHTHLAAYPSAKIIKYSQEKDETDTELALLLARELGAKRILLVGGGEGRVDHLLSIIQIFKGNLAPDLWLTAHEAIHLISPHRPYRALLKEHATISFFPLIAPSQAIQAAGLKWPFSSFDHLHSQMSLSNQVSSHQIVEVSIKDGLLLAIIPYEESI